MPVPPYRRSIVDLSRRDTVLLDEIRGRAGLAALLTGLAARCTYEGHRTTGLASAKWRRASGMVREVAEFVAALDEEAMGSK